MMKSRNILNYAIIPVISLFAALAAFGGYSLVKTEDSKVYSANEPRTVFINIENSGWIENYYVKLYGGDYSYNGDGIVTMNPVKNYENWYVASIGACDAFYISNSEGWESEDRRTNEISDGSNVFFFTGGETSNGRREISSLTVESPTAFVKSYSSTTAYLSGTIRGEIVSTTITGSMNGDIATERLSLFPSDEVRILYNGRIAEKSVGEYGVYDLRVNANGIPSVTEVSATLSSVKSKVSKDKNYLLLMTGIHVEDYDFECTIGYLVNGVECGNGENGGFSDEYYSGVIVNGLDYVVTPSVLYGADTVNDGLIVYEIECEKGKTYSVQPIVKDADGYIRFVGSVVRGTPDP